MPVKKGDYLGFSLTQAVSQFGSFFTAFAISWIIIDAAKSAKWLAFYLSYSVVLYSGLSLAAGWIMDRFPRKRIMVIAESAGLLCLAGLAVLEALGRSGTAVYFAATFITHFSGTLIMVGTQSVMGDFSGGKDVAKAQATFETARRLVMLASPLLAGAALASLPRWSVFALDSLSYLVSMCGTIAFLPRIDGPAAEKTSVRGRPLLPDIAWNTRAFLIVGFMIILNLVYAPVMMMWPLLAKNFDMGPRLMGALSSGFAIGAFFGGLWTIKTNTKMSRGQLSMPALLIAMGFGGFFLAAFAHAYVMVLPAAMLGFGFGSVSGPLMQVVHSLVPRESKGGFFGWMGFTGQIGQPVMLFIAGIIFADYGYAAFISFMSVLGVVLYLITLCAGVGDETACTCEEASL
jgi:MFS family permease